MAQNCQNAPKLPHWYPKLPKSPNGPKWPKIYQMPKFGPNDTKLSHTKLQNYPNQKMEIRHNQLFGGMLRSNLNRPWNAACVRKVVLWRVIVLWFGQFSNLGKNLASFWQFGPFGSFGPIGPNCVIWSILGHLGILGHFGTFGSFATFGPIGPNCEFLLFFGIFGFFWYFCAFFGHLGHFWPFRPFGHFFSFFSLKMHCKRVGICPGNFCGCPAHRSRKYSDPLTMHF